MSESQGPTLCTGGPPPRADCPKCGGKRTRTVADLTTDRCEACGAEFAIGDGYGLVGLGMYADAPETEESQGQEPEDGPVIDVMVEGMKEGLE